MSAADVTATMEMTTLQQLQQTELLEHTDMFAMCDDALFDGFDLLANSFDGLDDLLSDASSNEDATSNEDTYATFGASLYAYSSSSSISSSCNSDSDEPAYTSSSASSTPTSSPSMVSSSSLMAHPPKQKQLVQSRTVVPSVSTTATQPPAPLLKRPRKHNRIEILKLRDEVVALEARAAKLRKRPDDVAVDHNKRQTTLASRPSPAVAAQYALRYSSSANQLADRALASLHRDRTSSVWLDVAVEQFAALQHAQTLNQTLRHALATQRTAGSAIHDLLQQQTTIEDLELLGELPTASPPAAAGPTRSRDPFLVDSADLHARVDQQQLESDLVSRMIASASGGSSGFHASTTKPDAVRGPVHEVTTHMRIASSVEALGRQIRRCIADNIRALFGAERALEVLAAQPFGSNLVHERRMFATIPTPFDGDVVAHGTSVLKLFSTATRHLLAVASKWRIQNTDVVLRETTYCIVTNAASDQSNEASLYQAFYRLHSERIEPSSATGSTLFRTAPDDCTRRIQEIATNYIGGRMREHMEQLQRAMLEEEARATSRNAAFELPKIQCPFYECPQE